MVVWKSGFKTCIYIHRFIYLLVDTYGLITNGLWSFNQWFHNSIIRVDMELYFRTFVFISESCLVHCMPSAWSLVYKVYQWLHFGAYEHSVKALNHIVPSLCQPKSWHFWQGFNTWGYSLSQSSCVTKVSLKTQNSRHEFGFILKIPKTIMHLDGWGYFYCPEIAGFKL